MKSFFLSLFDFFLPKTCAACEKKLFQNENIICPLCLSTLTFASEERLEMEYASKFFEKKIIENTFSTFVFEKEKELQKIIHELKYKQRFQIGVFLGELTGEKIKEKTDEWMIDLIIPVPLHSAKKAERGYNQSDYIAKGLSKKLNIPYSTNIIKRKKFTASQTKLHKDKREENVKDAFFINKKDLIKNKNVMLVDDVITTGATINSCGKVLIENGAKKIYAVSVAVADVE